MLAALAAVRPAGHGALTLDAVYVNRAGRVKVADLAMGPAVPAAIKLGMLPAGALAPDKQAGPAGDAWAVGQLAYELLVGRPLARGGPRPSDVDGLGPEIDELIARCCSPDPAKRPADPDALRVQMVDALKSKRAPAQAQAPAASASLAPSPSASGSFPGLSASQSSPSLAQAIRASGRASGQQAAAVIADGDEKWLVSKGKLDFGPFTLAHVMEDIRTNQILPGHVIVDKDTGGRCNVEDHPLLSALVDEAKQKRDDERRAHAEVVHTKKESRRGLTLYAFIGVGVIAIGLVVFFVIRALGSDKFHAKVEVQGSAGEARYEYVVVAFVDQGRSGKASEKASTGKGPAQLSDKDFVRVSWPKIGGAVSYQIYRVAGPDAVLGTGLIAEVDADT
ncbi:MAG TPA: hypothetical protein VL172_22820, partial [Kofleriaceae bacterium]|nr:hypothetical protein [Kofleriaceae bacterium]